MLTNVESTHAPNGYGKRGNITPVTNAGKRFLQDLRQISSGNPKNGYNASNTL